MAGLERYKASADWRRRLQDAPDGRFLQSMETFIADRLYRDQPAAADEPQDEFDARAADEVIPANARMPDWGI